MSAALAVASAASSDRASEVPRAFVASRSSVRSVARGEDDIDSPVDVISLTSGANVVGAIVGSRIARRQMSRSGNNDAAGRPATSATIVRENAGTTAGLGGAFDFST